MVLLLNSAVMPTEGHYTLKKISQSEFRTVLRDAAAANDFRSYIGYPETACLIEQLTDVEIEVSREQAELATGDVILIAKLRHRVQNPSDIAIYHPSLDDLDFFICDWRPLIEGETFA